jgi:uncharacterized protein (DUF58 family)
MVFFLLAGIILAAGLKIQSNLLFWTFGLMVGGLAVSYMVASQMLRNIEVTRILPLQAITGEATSIRYKIVNHKTIVPIFGLIITENWGKGRHGWKTTGPVADPLQRLMGRPFAWALHVAPNQTMEIESVCWPLRRGSLKFDRIVVMCGFPFGLVQRVIEIEQPEEVLVYPRLYRLHRKILGDQQQTNRAGGTRHKEQGGGHEEFFGLRDYRPGDSLKLVDWKRTARTGELITRELNIATPPRVMFNLDLTALPMGKRLDEPGSQSQEVNQEQMANPMLMDAAEEAVSLTASLICDAYNRGYQIGLSVTGMHTQPFPIYHSFSHRQRMLESLAMLDLGRRSEQVVAGATPPNIVVRIGPGMPILRGANKPGVMIMGTDRLDEYVITEDAEEPGDVLNRRTVPESRRQSVMEARS